MVAGGDLSLPGRLPIFDAPSTEARGGREGPEGAAAGGGATPYLEYGLKLSKVLKFGADDPRNCDPVVYYFTCGCSVHTIQSGCKNQDCSDCAHEVKSQRKRRVLDRIQVGRVRFLRLSEFTVPQDHRERLTTPEACKRYRQAAWEILKDVGAAEWGLAMLHPEGRQEPGVFKPHWHFAWCDRWQRRGTLTKGQVLEIRARWRAFLQHDESDVNVHHHFARVSDKEKLDHAVRYVVRPFPGWGEKLKLRVTWYGTYPITKGVFHEKTRCGSCGKPLRFLCSGTLVEHKQWERGGRLLGLPPPACEGRGLP